MLLASLLLVHHRCAVADRLTRGMMHDQVAVVVESPTLGVAEVERDVRRVRAGSDAEVLGEPALAAAVNHADAGVGVGRKLLIGVDVGSPLVGLVADEIVRFAGQHLLARRLSP